jgi:hypothetical protein
VLHTPKFWQFEQFNVHGQPMGIPPGTSPLHPGGMVGQVVVLVVVLVVVVVDVVVVVVDVVGHGVVRGRHFRTNVSRSLRGLVPFAAVAFAESRTWTMAGCVPFLSGSGIATKLPQAEPSKEPGTAPASLGGLTKSFWSPVGGWQAAACWQPRGVDRRVLARGGGMVLFHRVTGFSRRPLRTLKVRPALRIEPGRFLLRRSSEVLEPCSR